MKKTYLLAGLFTVCLGLWMGSGLLGESTIAEDSSIAERNLDSLGQAGLDLTRVRTTAKTATYKTRTVQVTGKTSHKREVMVQAQLDGLIEARPVERGDFVEAGDLLCQISTEDRQARLVEARAQVEQSRLLYTSNQKLSKQGLLSDARLSESRAQLKLAEANLLKRQLESERLQLTAPFSGFVETVHAEVGQFVTPGMACATLVELNPLLVRGDLSESKVRGVEVGRAARITVDGFEPLSGRVSFVSHVAKMGTKTFEIEIQVDNDSYQLSSGLSADIEISLDQMLAHRVSPGLLILSDEGRPGLRSVVQDRVVFNSIDIIGEDDIGIWVAGLPNEVELITVGQHAVSDGERVVSVSEASIARPINEQG